VQFNDASAFGGDAGLTYNKTTDALSAGRLLTTDGTAAAPALSFASSPNTGFFQALPGYIGYAGGGTFALRFGVNDFVVGPAFRLGWANATFTAYTTVLYESTPGTLEINNGTVGTYRDLNVRNLTGSGIVSGAGTTGAIAVASPAGAYLQTFGVSGAGNAAYMVFQRAGAFAGLFGLDTDNQWKIGGWSYGAVSYRILHEGNAFTIDANSNLIMAVASRTLRAGALVGSYLLVSASAYSGPLNFGSGAAGVQTAGLVAGSVISSIATAPGQVFRILVSGAAGITLPAATKWAVGSPTWGPTYTIISGFSHDGSLIFASTTPF
jgi:hypothetical protein